MKSNTKAPASPRRTGGAPNTKQADWQRVNVDFPVDVLAAIDREADRVGVTRQAWIKMRLTDWLAANAAPVVGKAARS